MDGIGWEWEVSKYVEWGMRVKKKVEKILYNLKKWGGREIGEEVNTGNF